MRRNYNLYYDVATPGMPSGLFAASPRIRAYKLNAGGVLEQYQVAIPGTVDASKEYKLIIDNAATVRFTTDADATQAELLAGLLNAIRTNPVAGARMLVSVSGNNLVLTSRQLG